MYNKETGTCTVCGHKPGECDYGKHNKFVGKINRGYRYDKNNPQPVETTFLASDSPIIEGPHKNLQGEIVITVASVQLYPPKRK